MADQTAEAGAVLAGLSAVGITVTAPVVAIGGALTLIARQLKPPSKPKPTQVQVEHKPLVERGEAQNYVSGLYRSILQREPDQSGLANWVNQLTTGIATKEEVSEAFYNSGEYKDLQKTKTSKTKNILMYAIGGIVILFIGFIVIKLISRK